MYSDTIKGLNKLFYASLLMPIVYFCLQYATGNTLIWVIILIIAFILHLIGLKSISKDIYVVNVAFYLTIIEFIISLFSTGDSTFPSIIVAILHSITYLCLFFPLSKKLKERNETLLAYFGCIIAIVAIIDQFFNLIWLVHMENKLIQLHSYYLKWDDKAAIADKLLNDTVLVLLITVAIYICQSVFFRKSSKAFEQIQNNIS